MDDASVAWRSVRYSDSNNFSKNVSLSLGVELAHACHVNSESES